MNQVAFESEKFAKAINDYLWSENLTLRDASVRCGVSASTLSRVQRGNKPDIDTFVVICTMLKIKPKKFFYSDFD